MRNEILEKISKGYIKKRSFFSVGDRVRVSVRLKEGDKERVQAFRGIVISKTPKSGRGSNAMFTVRKISEGVGVERIFPINAPSIEKIEVEGSSQVRRSRLYYLRQLKGKKARLKEVERFGEFLLPEEPATPEPADVVSQAPSAEGQTAVPAAPAPQSKPETKSKESKDSKVPDSKSDKKK